MSDRPALPPALAKLEEKPAGLVIESRSFCTLHGVQDGQNCSACDEHFPDAVKARELGQPAIAVGFTEDQVAKMVQKAVKEAMAERDAFDRWKASPEGQAAAAAAPTAGAVPPDHGAE